MTIIRIKTRDPVGHIVTANNTAAWPGKRERFEEATHFVIIGKDAQGPTMIAEIDSVVAVPESGPNRFALCFSKYCELDPQQTKYNEDGSSHPAISKPLSDVLPGLCLDDLDWQSAPPPDPAFPWSFSGAESPAKRGSKSAAGLTIAEAKRGLSIGLGIPERAIKISIST